MVWPLGEQGRMINEACRKRDARRVLPAGLRRVWEITHELKARIATVVKGSENYLIHQEREK